MMNDGSRGTKNGRNWREKGRPGIGKKKESTVKKEKPFKLQTLEKKQKKGAQDISMLYR